MEQFYGTGRRKTSKARVFLRPGTGKVTVNNQKPEEYFGREVYRQTIINPLIATELLDKFDIFATVTGGGTTGQAGAIRLGVSRALLESDAELRPTLKSKGYLTCDSRQVERKKYGQKGARGRFQFSKR